MADESNHPSAVSEIPVQQPSLGSQTTLWRKSRVGRSIRLLLLSLVLLFVALVSMMTAMRLAIHGRQVIAPDLTGTTQSEAREAAEGLGLRVVPETRFYSSQVAEGRIVSQSPASGTSVRRGSRVRVAISLGPQRAQVPDVVGQSPRAAEINIHRRGLEVGTVAQMAVLNGSGGEIVAQSPTPEAKRVASPRVNLLVTTAAPEPFFVMPSLIGRKFAEARPQIEAAGFKIANVRDVTPPATPEEVAQPSESMPSSAKPVPAGAVILRQSPAAGQRIGTDAQISLDVVKPL